MLSSSKHSGAFFNDLLDCAQRAALRYRKDRWAGNRVLFAMSDLRKNLCRAAAVIVAAAVFLPLSGSAYAQEFKKVRIGYPAFSLTFLTFFVGKDAGIYKKHGLDVDLVQMAGAVQTSALVAGEIDYLTGITTPLVAAARGLPLQGNHDHA